MASSQDFTLLFSEHENYHPRFYFWGRMASGSLMVGSSVVQPQFSEQLGSWAAFSLLLFLPSWCVFNALQVSRILIHGHLTVVASLICLVIAIAFGPRQLSDHVPWLPIYAASASILTFCWEPLHNSCLRLKRGDYTFIAMEDMEDPEAARTSSDDGRTYPPPPDYVSMEHQAQRPPDQEEHNMLGTHETDEDLFSDLLCSTVDVQDVGDQETVPETQNMHGIPIEFEHMKGPSSHNTSRNVAHSDSSIGLSSRATIPSDISPTVWPLLGDQRMKKPRSDQRRLDAARLGLESMDSNDYPPPRSVASSTRPVVLSRLADGT